MYLQNREQIKKYHILKQTIINVLHAPEVEQAYK